MDIIIPFRDRNDQLEHFKTNIAPKMLKKQNRIFIIQQSNDGELFNRGALLNIGVIESTENANEVICFHDVDLEPSDKLIETYYPPQNKMLNIHLASCWRNPRYTKKTYYGGVIIVPRQWVLQCDGFPNNYWGWGGEDDEFARRLTTFNPKIHHVYETKEYYMTDLENLNLNEKMNVLKRSNAKNMLKWELLEESKQNNEEFSHTNGIEKIQYDILQRYVDKDTTTIFVNLQKKHTKDTKNIKNIKNKNKK